MTREPDTLVKPEAAAPRETAELTRQIARAHDAILAVLDASVLDAARARGLELGAAGELAGGGALQVTAGMLAYRLAAMIVDPATAGAEFELAAFHAALRARFTP